MDAFKESFSHSYIPRRYEIRAKRDQSDQASIVWAIDAFSHDFETQARTAEALLAHCPECAIHPVYVLSEEVFSGQGYSSFLRPALKPKAHHNLVAVLNQDCMKPLRSKGLLQPPCVLVEETADASRCTGQLLRYAKQVGAKLIAIGTHRRSQFKHWFTGSFAQTLIRNSSLPLLVTGPRQEPELTARRSLVVPIEPCSESRHSFEQLVELAQAHHLDLHLIHPIARKFGPWAQSCVLTFGAVHVSLEDMSFEAGNRDLEDWKQLAHDKSVSLTFVPENSDESLIQMILKTANQLEAPMIGISPGSARAKHGWLPAGLTHDLIRWSPHPVYVLAHSV